MCLFLKVRAELVQFPDLVTECTLQHRAMFEAGGTPLLASVLQLIVELWCFSKVKTIVTVKLKSESKHIEAFKVLM